MYHYNGAQCYKHHLQVGRLDRAVILLGLALYHPSASISSIFMALYVSLIFFLHSLLYPLVSWLTDPQCHDTAGWVIWPVKSSPNWPTMCGVGCWTLLCQSHHIMNSVLTNRQTSTNINIFKYPILNWTRNQIITSKSVQCRQDAQSNTFLLKLSKFFLRQISMLSSQTFDCNTPNR